MMVVVKFGKPMTPPEAQFSELVYHRMSGIERAVYRGV